jgi:hypothetical protein
MSSQPPVQARPETGQLLFAAALALGVALRAVDLVNCRSLGLDEARLAVNISARSFAGLLQPLDLDQGAPPLFLWGQRLGVLLLGHADCALRVLPFAAGTTAAVLAYPLAAGFLRPAESRIAAAIVILCPLLITYTNAVKQYSVELLVAIAFLLTWERALAEGAVRRSRTRLLLAGAVVPWLSLTSVFLLAACWLNLMVRWVRGRADAARLLLIGTLIWGLSALAAYLTVYRAAARNPYLYRFWELAFVVPTRSGFPSHLWKTLEDHTWGFLAGDPVLDRRPYLLLLHLGTVAALLLCAIGVVRIVRARGGQACWYLCGPILTTLSAALLGAFPLAPRLTIFLLPSLVVLFVAGVTALSSGEPSRSSRAVFTALSIVLVLPMALYGVAGVFALEPSGHFQRLVRELREHRLPGERVYVFARTLPPWIYYSTDWSNPDTSRLKFLTRVASAGGRAFENAPSRGHVRPEEAGGLSDPPGDYGEILGLPSGMEWREVEEYVRSQPDSGWVEVESRRIRGAANPGVWVIATAFYPAERELFRVLEHAATRRTFAHLRSGSALVRYEFNPFPRSGLSRGDKVHMQTRRAETEAP